MTEDMAKKMAELKESIRRQVGDTTHYCYVLSPSAMLKLTGDVRVVPLTRNGHQVYVRDLPPGVDALFVHQSDLEDLNLQLQKPVDEIRVKVIEEHLAALPEAGRRALFHHLGRRFCFHCGLDFIATHRAFCHCGEA